MLSSRATFWTPILTSTGDFLSQVLQCQWTVPRLTRAVDGFFPRLAGREARGSPPGETSHQPGGDILGHRRALGQPVSGGDLGHARQRDRHEEGLVVLE